MPSTPADPCPTCGALPDSDYSYSKYGWPDDDIPMEPGGSALVVVAGSISGGRGETLERCPTCGQHFHRKHSYEFLVTGSEDEEWLTRIDTAEADELRARLS